MAPRRNFPIVKITLESFNSTKLPTNRQVIQRVLHLVVVKKQKVKDACSTVCDEVISIWDRALPAMIHSDQKNIINKVFNYYEKYNSKIIKPSYARSKEAQAKRELEFVGDGFDVAFDIRRKDWTEHLTGEGDRKFLLSQFTPGQPGRMTRRYDYEAINREASIQIV